MMTTRDQNLGPFATLNPIVATCLVSIFLVAATANAALILQADFDSLMPGAVTAATLNGATMGGTWLLDGTSSHSIESDLPGNGDQAFLSSHTAAATGVRVSLDTAVDIDVDLFGGDLMIDFVTATRDSTGFTRDAFWRLLDDGGLTLVTIEIDDGQVILNGSNIGTLSDAADSFSVRPWDSTDVDVITASIVIDSLGDVDLTMTDNQGPITLVNGSTSIAASSLFQSIETSWAAGRVDPANGIYLNDISVFAGPAVVPEPGTWATFGILAACLIACWRRRRAA